LNAIADHEGAYHRKIINEFNYVYSVENNLDITVNANPIPMENTQDTFKNYGYIFSTNLNKGLKKYDIIHIYSAYSKVYGEHFEDLRKYFDDEDLSVYDSAVLNEICTNKDNKLIGLPFSLNVNALYSNKELLKKYDQPIPKTWKELVDISGLIYEEEKKNSHRNITRYRSGLDDLLTGTLTIAEFINSFREKKEDKFPELRSQTTKDALTELKGMIEQMGIDNFKADGAQLADNIFREDVLFLVYGMSPYNPHFEQSALPGKNEDVSGTILSTNNFGINKYIDEDKKKAAVKFLKFVALKNIQHEFIIRDQFMGSNMELYNPGEKSCAYVNCTVIEKIRPFSYLNNDKKLFGNDEYFKYYQKFMLDYLFRNEDLDHVLKRLEDVTKVHTFSINTDDSFIGLIIYIIFIVFFAVIALSIIFIFIKKLEYRFKFLSKNLWVLTTLGSLILLSSIITLYGEVSNAKCHLRTTLINVGFILSICPSFYKLISNFPERNQIPSILKVNKYIIIAFVMLITVALNEAFAMTSYDLYEVNGDVGPELNLNAPPRKHFEICVMESFVGNIFYYIIQLLNFLNFWYFLQFLGSYQ